MRNYAPNSPYDFRGRGLWAWWDFTDTNALFVEEDRTAPVTANLDEIGWVEDKSGNGRHLYQGTSSARPLFLTNQVNGLGCAGFGSVGSGAVDDYFNISNPGILNANWTIAVLTITNTAASKAIFGAAAGGWIELFDSSEVLSGRQSSGSTVYAASVGLTAATWTVVYTNYGGHAKAHVTLAGVDRSPTNYAATDQTQTANTALFGANTGPSSFYDGCIAEIIKGAGKTNYEDPRRIMQNYIHPKYGLAI